MLQSWHLRRRQSNVRNRLAAFSQQTGHDILGDVQRGESIQVGRRSKSVHAIVFTADVVVSYLASILTELIVGGRNIEFVVHSQGLPLRSCYGLPTTNRSCSRRFPACFCRKTTCDFTSRMNEDPTCPIHPAPCGWMLQLEDGRKSC
jgi:hypothetical protein